MRLPNYLSIRARLVLLAMVSASGAMLLMCFGFAVTYVSTLKTAKVEQLSAQAHILAFNATGVLTFNDPGAGRDLLASLGSQPDVEFACLYGLKPGALVATALMVPRSLLTTRVASASPSISSAMMASGRPA